MKQKSLVPPRFAIAASPFLYDPDLPDHLYRTYARIVGLAWQKEEETERSYEKTPALTVYELAVICNLSVRNVWRHIRDLGERGLLTWEEKKGVQTRMVFYPVWPGSMAGLADAFDLTGEPAGEAPAGQVSLTTETVGETHQALAEFGVNILEPLAGQVAALPHVTPELVRAWGHNLLQRSGIHNRRRPSQRPPHPHRRLLSRSFLPRQRSVVRAKPKSVKLCRKSWSRPSRTWAGRGTMPGGR